MLHTVTVNTPPSRRLLRACAAFGITVRQAPANSNDAPPAPPPEASKLLATLPASGLALITGPSGSGKSTLLNAVEASCGPLAVRVARDQGGPDPRPIIDRIEGSLGEALATLASAGLAEAPLLCRAAHELSEGQRARFDLARAFARCNAADRSILFVDEFASTLDRLTARCLCLTLRRWLRRAARRGLHTRAIVATAHDDVLEWLSPDTTIDLSASPHLRGA